MHALIHVMDFIRYKKYVPMILTTTLMLVYSVVAFHDVIVQVEVNWVRVAFWFAVTLLVNIVAGSGIIRLARKFGIWLNSGYLQDRGRS
ncbi:MAG TPA: hypothetical protein PKD55_06405 [Bellilinea sp.]|nr:hypothetical protein [Bellilinea sp.]